MVLRSILWLAAAATVALPPMAFAQSEMFPFGEPALGKKVLEAKCDGCHVRRFGGDGSLVYTRDGRKVSSAQSLLAWVQRCNVANGTGLGGEEEESVAAYLNATYYKFK